MSPETKPMHTNTMLPQARLVASGGPVSRAVAAMRRDHPEERRRAKMCARLDSIIERAIALRDALDGDPDLEPSLGWTLTMGLGGTDDRENAHCADDDGEEVPYLPPAGLRLGTSL